MASLAVANASRDRSRSLWYSYKVVDGRTVRTYIGKNLPPGVQVPASQHSPSTTVNPSVMRLADMRDARETVESEIDELDRLLALDPASERSCHD